MSRILKNIQRAQAAGKMPPEDAKAETDLYKSVLREYKGDKEAADREFRSFFKDEDGVRRMATWIAKVRTEREHPPLSLTTKAVP
jgi:hypothetical protein